MFNEIFAGRVIMVTYNNRKASSSKRTALYTDESTPKYIALMQNEYSARYAVLTFESGIETVIFDVDEVKLSKEE